jgi:hypothetical protein
MDQFKGAADILGGHEIKTPPKIVKHVLHRHTANKGHVFEHHHTHPEAHPMEEHAFGDNETALNHFSQNILGNPAGSAPAGGPAEGTEAAAGVMT